MKKRSGIHIDNIDCNSVSFSFALSSYEQQLLLWAINCGGNFLHAFYQSRCELCARPLKITHTKRMPRDRERESERVRKESTNNARRLCRESEFVLFVHSDLLFLFVSSTFCLVPSIRLRHNFARSLSTYHISAMFAPLLFYFTLFFCFAFFFYWNKFRSDYWTIVYWHQKWQMHHKQINYLLASVRSASSTIEHLSPKSNQALHDRNWCPIPRVLLKMRMQQLDALQPFHDLSLISHVTK